MTSKLRAVIQHLFSLAHESDGAISNLALQKLLYFAWGVYWMEKQKQLFNDPFEAWQYGPVIPKVYQHFKAYHDQNVIGEKLCDQAHIDQYLSLEEKNAIATTWHNYGGKPTMSLVNETHRNGTPWHQAVSSKTSSISREDMEMFFGGAKLINQYRDVLVQLART